MIKKILAAALAVVCLIGTGCDYYKQMPIETGGNEALTLQDKIKGTWYYKRKKQNIIKMLLILLKLQKMKYILL